MVVSPHAHHLAYPKYQLQDTMIAVKTTMHSTAAHKQMNPRNEVWTKRKKEETQKRVEVSAIQMKDDRSMKKEREKERKKPRQKKRKEGRQRK